MKTSPAFGWRYFHQKTRTILFVLLPVSFFVVAILGSPSAPPPPWFLTLWKVKKARPRNGQNSLWGENIEKTRRPQDAKIQHGAKTGRTSLNVSTTAQHKHTTTHNNTIMEDWPNWLAQNGGSTDTGFLPVFAFFFFFLSKSKNPKNWPKSKLVWVSTNAVLHLMTFWRFLGPLFSRCFYPI